MPHLTADALTEDAEGLVFLASVLNEPVLAQVPILVKTPLSTKRASRRRRSPSAGTGSVAPLAGSEVAA